MRLGLASWSAGLLLGASAACQSIIGIDGYEIDSSLDAAHEGGAGNSKPAAPSAGETGEGESASGSGPAPEVAGAGGGGTSAECRSDQDCDDTVDCTIDRCSDERCVHEADHSACVPDAGECLTCRVGIGCVAAAATMQELLLDPAFDLGEQDWTEDSTSGASLIRADDAAQTAPSSARLGPAPDGVAEEYADLYQLVTIPDGTQSITLSGYYQLLPGVQRAAQDMAIAALYESGAEDYALLWHAWEGTDPAQYTWRQFSYTASADEVAALTGGPYSFDLLAYTGDSVFRFDSLSLLAQSCQ